MSHISCNVFEFVFGTFWSVGCKKSHRSGGPCSWCPMQGVDLNLMRLSFLPASKTVARYPLGTKALSLHAHNTRVCRTGHVTVLQHCGSLLTKFL